MALQGGCSNTCGVGAKAQVELQCFHLPTIPEREEEEGDILKGEVRCEEELNLTVPSGSVAPQVMIYQAQHDYPKYLMVFCCAQCNKPFSSKSAAKSHRRRKCKGVEVISLCDI